MRYTIILIDDDPVILAQQADKFRKFHWVIVIGTFTSIQEAWFFLKKRRRKVDIICCDIEMPGVNGLSGAELLRGKARLTVFITGFPQHTLAAYERSVDMYELKPLTEAAVLKILDKLEARQGFRGLRDAPSGCLMVLGYGTEQFINVPMRDITKIVTDDHYVQVFAPELVGTAHMTMEDVTIYLADSDWFIQVNQSTVIALSFIIRMEKGKLYTKDGKEYLLGRVFGPGVRDFMKRNQLRGSRDEG